MPIDFKSNRILIVSTMKSLLKNITTQFSQ